MIPVTQEFGFKDFLSTPTLLELLSDSGYDEYAKFFNAKADCVDHYSDIYKVTFGQANSNTEEVVSFLKSKGLTKDRSILEIFAGNAFESMLLQKQLPDNKYTAVDISPVEEFETIKYRTEDCLVRPKQDWGFDFVFIGAANASMCTAIYNLNHLHNLISYVGCNLARNGYVALSFFEGRTWAEDLGVSYEVTYAVNEINYIDKYKGLYAHWATVIRHDIKTKSQSYYSFVIVDENEILEKVTAPKHYYYFNKPFVTRSWDFATIKDVMEQRDFRYEQTRFVKDEERFCVFRKLF